MKNNYLDPKEALKIVDLRLKNDKRFNRIEDASKIVGWQVITNKNQYRIITSNLYNTAPYERNKSQLTINYKDTKNKSLEKLQKWLNKNI